MSEYIEVVGAAGNTLINDSFRCYHLVGKFTKTRADLYTPAKMAFDINDLVYAFDITVSSISQPIIASADCSIFQCSYTKLSGSTWKIVIYVSRVANWPDVTKPIPASFSFNFYVYGLQEEYVKVKNKPVVEVFNAEGKLVYSSELKYLKIIKSFNEYMPDVEPNFFSYYDQKAYSIPIPNYDPLKKYAVIPAATAHVYQWFDGGGLRQNNMSSFKIKGSNVAVGMYPTGFGYLQDFMDAYIPTLAVLIIDVTDI